MIPDKFIEFYYGKHSEVDLHKLTKEEAKAELIYTLSSIDIDIKCIVVVHGYHGGTVIKNFVRNEFKSPKIAEKINFDAGRTIFVLKNWIKFAKSVEIYKWLCYNNTIIDLGRNYGSF